MPVRPRLALRAGIIALAYLYPAAAYFLGYLPFLVPRMRNGGDVFASEVALASGYLLTLVALGSTVTTLSIALHTIGVTASLMTLAGALTFFSMPAFGNLGNGTVAGYLADPKWAILCGVVIGILLVGRLLGLVVTVLRSRLRQLRPDAGSRP